MTHKNHCASLNDGNTCVFLMKNKAVAFLSSKWHFGSIACENPFMSTWRTVSGEAGGTCAGSPLQPGPVLSNQPITSALVCGGKPPKAPGLKSKITHCFRRT